ncbi:MAG: serine/threonine protein kinase [Planctomycetes bacterium]|nr:serine/threonine protein kinase [Planctomycetota bacterium]
MKVDVLDLRQGAEPYPGYRLVHFLGKGGWGQVWKVKRLADGKHLAVKFLASQSQLASAQEIRALQAIRQLRHPHILQMEQVWSCPGFIAILMELAEGSLLDLLEMYLADYKTPIPADHACDFLSQVALALDFLNAGHHLVDGQRVAFRHCDVKPSNLLLFGRTVKLADFSLAVQSTVSMTNHRRTGTLNYAAPEVFQGRLSDRTDQYALAVTYVHLRTGSFPFGNTPSTFSEAYQRPTPDLSLVCPVERPILSRALDPVAPNRWSSCVEMMDMLTRCATPTPVAC